ncbi:LPXTG cell wall anchor domain-containing protein [Clostridium sp. Cult2]|uniref:LPXTG cell wall anchor domain-containing protein n=1 Tax=Clostridium sp. Cult2 TaxID=2079003 RepID=UPI001F37373C|nr:LPXTG cell wall anchor domain-containing protein [Clostridium sp. Cult2]
MKKSLSKIFTTIGFSLIIAGLIFSSFLSTIYAADLELIGKDTGLVVEPANERLFDLTNLNPGDTKTAKITIKNNYNNPFNLYMRAERMGEAPADGADLFDILILTVTLKGNKIYEGPIKDFATSNIALGRFNTGSNEELIATVHLPGPETGNEYQGKSVDVKWIFIAESIAPPGDDPGDSDEPWEPPVTIRDEEVPAGEPKAPEKPIEEPKEPIEEPEEPEVPEEPIEEPEEPIEEIEEEIPEGIPMLPKTGEASLVLFYILGGAMVLLGLGLGFKKKE